LPTGKHSGILTDYQTKVKKKIKNIHRRECGELVDECMREWVDEA
jgi:hypothetical protein